MPRQPFKVRGSLRPALAVLALTVWLAGVLAAWCRSTADASEAGSPETTAVQESDEHPPSIDVAPDPALAGDVDYQSALRAMADGLPGVAAAKLGRVLESATLDPGIAARVRLQLAEARLRNGEAGAALDALDAIPGDAEAGIAVPAAFWRAHALSRLGKLNAALTEIRTVLPAAKLPPEADPEAPADATLPASHGALRRGARLLESRLLFTLGDAEAALEALQPLLTPQDHGPAGRSVPSSEADRDEFAAVARIRAAELHLSGNRADAARSVLAGAQHLPPRLAPRIAYLKARIALADGDVRSALSALGGFPQDAPLPPDIAPYLTLARADALDLDNRREEARVLLRSFISENPASPLLGPVFARLESMGGFASPEGLATLAGWADSTTAPESLAAPAAFHRALALAQANEHGNAIAVMKGFLEARPAHQLALRGQIELAGWLIEEQKPAEAHRVIRSIRATAASPEVAARVAFLEGQLLFELGEYEEAEAAFERAGMEAQVPGPDHDERPDGASDTVPPRPIDAKSADPAPAGRPRSPDLRPRDPRIIAAFNAALAAAKAEEEKRFRELAALVASYPEGTTPVGLHAVLLLEHALFLSASGASEAGDALQGFLDSYPEHARAWQAHLALAELALLAFPPRPKSARDQLAAAASTGSGSPADRQQTDYLAIWIAESEAKYAEAAALGERFLQRWTSGDLRDDVLMKLGELHFRQEDYPNAQRYLEVLATEAPNSRFAEAALFFAGKAALLTLAPGSLDNAITLWEKVASREGPLRHFAREQQAQALRRLGREVEAAQIFDSILAQEDEIDPAFRFSILLAKGETLVSIGSEAPERISQAIDLFDEVVHHPAATPAWRREALYRKGKALESLDREDEALEAYYDVLGPDGTIPLGATASPQEHLWLYRAGFEAVRILETRKRWNAAVAMAERLAASGGPRASEAGARAERIRLEQFLWDEDSPDSGRPASPTATKNTNAESNPGPPDPAPPAATDAYRSASPARGADAGNPGD